MADSIFLDYSVQVVRLVRLSFGECQAWHNLVADYVASLEGVVTRSSLVDSQGLPIQLRLGDALWQELVWILRRS